MWKKITGYTLLTLVCVASAGFGYLYFRKPASRPPANLRVAMTPERIARGKYIYTLADCDNCHSPHNPTKLYLPVVEARRGSGQSFEEGDQTLHIPNTPDPETGIGSWTDGEKIRAIREGIGKHGNVLFPMMPYTMYRHMSDDDVQSLVAYLNTLSPVKNKMPRMQPPFLLSLMIKGAPQPVLQPVSTPSPNQGLAYGEYLVTVGACESCHTPRERGAPVMTKRLAGGNRFAFGDVVVNSANISPHPATGIGNWTEEYFLNRFRRHRTMSVDSLPPAAKEQFTIMPWRNLSQLPDDDLRAIYRYLSSCTPVENKVTVHPAELAQR